MPRLRRSRITAPGVRRVRRGRGFAYLGHDGSPIVDGALLERCAALAIPPAWTDVWICPYDNGHIQATGLDAAGRRQYLYHEVWRAQKDRVKFDRMLELAAAIGPARRSVTRDLAADAITRERIHAAAFRMLDAGSLRMGSDRYSEEHGSYGLSTLLCAHVRVLDGRAVRLRFPAKSGQRRESEIVDPALAPLIAELASRGRRARLLAWPDASRGRLRWRPLRPEDINADIRARAGGEFSAKDFRTLRGTSAAAASLTRTGPASTVRGRRAAIALAMRDAAEVLGNTPAIARASYVDPRIIDRYERGQVLELPRGRTVERALLELIGA